MRDVGDALDQVRGSGAPVPSGSLRINAPPPAIDLVLAPMVAPFLKRYPQIELEIVAEVAMIDIVEHGFDAGVRYGEHLAQDMIAVSIGPPQRYAVVASPDVIAVHGRPKHPKDLLPLPASAPGFRPGRCSSGSSRRRAAWSSCHRRPFSSRLGASALQLQAALDGVGFFATFEGYVREHVAAGRLVSVLDDWCQPFPGPFLYYPSRRQLPPALGAFIHVRAGVAKGWTAPRDLVEQRASASSFLDRMPL